MKLVHKEKESTRVKYYNLEEANLKGFITFCKNNIPLIISVSFALFFTYGIKLFWEYTIGNDTAWFMADKTGILAACTQVGRFGLSMLSKLWFIKEFNPFISFYMTFCLIWLFTISWCYIIAIFSGETNRNNKLIPFALIFMTMPIWVEQFYFILQSAEIALIITLCPFVIYLLFKGFLDNEKGKIFCGFALLVFIFSVYQAMIPFFCCGVFICFLLFQERSNYKPKIYWNLFLKITITAISALLVYFIISNIIILLFMKGERADYLDYYVLWGKVPVWENIRNVLIFIYIITIGNFPVVQKLVAPFTNTEGVEVIAHLANMSRIFGSVLLLPVILLFLIKITQVMRKKIASGHQLLFFLVCICIPLSIIFIAFVGGNVPPLRSTFALPLAFAFMIYYLIKTYKKIFAVIVFCLAIITSVHQAQISAQLFFSDQMRYNEDVRVAFELNDLILQAQPEDNNLPIAFIGLYDTSMQLNPNFIMGEGVGHSNFSWGIWSLYAITPRALAFMNCLGIFFDRANENQIDQAYEESISMTAYPNPECVKQMQDFIVVKLGNTEYKNLKKEIAF